MGSKTSAEGIIIMKIKLTISTDKTDWVDFAQRENIRCSLVKENTYELLGQFESLVRLVRREFSDTEQELQEILDSAVEIII